MIPGGRGRAGGRAVGSNTFPAPAGTFSSKEISHGCAALSLAAFTLPQWKIHAPEVGRTKSKPFFAAAAIIRRINSSVSIAGAAERSFTG